MAVTVTRGDKYWAFTTPIAYDPQVNEVLRRCNGTQRGHLWLIPADRGMVALAALQLAGHQIKIDRTTYTGPIPDGPAAKGEDPLFREKTFGEKPSHHRFGFEDDPTFKADEWLRDFREQARRTEEWLRAERERREQRQREQRQWGASAGTNQQQQQARPPRPDRGERTWADALLTAAGPELAPRVFKALAAVLHPDTGGDTTLMQQLNAARDRSK